MKRFWQRGQDLETELRNHRPEPRSEFLAGLTAVVEDRMRRPKTAMRAAFALAVTIGMLVVFASFGGLGYASSAADHALNVSKIGRLVGISSQSDQGTSQSDRAQLDSRKGADDHEGDDHQNPGHHQYHHGHGCQDENHVPSGNNHCKPKHP